MFSTSTRLAVFALTLLPTVALAQVRAGVTTKAEIRKAYGNPMEFTTDALHGDVALNLVPGNPDTVDAAFDEARTDPFKRRPALYEVLQYWVSPSSMETMSFVFLPGDDRLLYAVIPPSPSEATAEKAIGRYGHAPVIRKRIHRMGHLQLVTVHVVFPREGVELLIDNPELRVARKILVDRDARGLAILPSTKLERD